MFSLILLSLLNIIPFTLSNKADEIDSKFKKERLSMVLIVKEGSTECNKAIELWNGLKTVFKNLISFIVLHQEQGLPKGYESKTYPAVKLYKRDKNKIEKYSGQITAEEIYNFGLKQIENVVKSAYKDKGFVFRDSYVIYLGINNFTRELENSPEPILVEFFAPWCGHCKSLKPAYEEAAKKLFGKAKLVAVDATVNEDLGKAYGIKGFPTLKFIAPMSKDLKKTIEYTGSRTAEGIISWVESQIASYVPPAELIQITSQSDFDSECLEKGLCVVTLFPNRLDSDASTWQKYISELKETINNIKTRNFGWVWLEGGVHGDFEEALGVGGFGYPVVLAINKQKKVFAVMKSSFDSSSINKFVNSLGSRSVITSTLPETLPPLKDTLSWDGNEFSKSSDL